MTVFGCRWRPARLLGKSQGLSDPGAGAEVRSRGEVLAQERSEWLGNIGGVPAEDDAHSGIAVVDDAGRERDDLDQGLGVEQQQHAGNSVGE